MKKIFVVCGLLFATVAVQAQEKTPLFRIDKKQKLTVKSISWSIIRVWIRFT